MYRKYAGMLLLISILTITAFICGEEKEMLYDLSAGNKIECHYDIIEGNQPHLTIQSVERTGVILSDEEKMILCKIVEAEAGGEDRKGKILVANVVLNRMENEAFPDTVAEVVFQREDGVTQFSPVANGKYEKAMPGEDTVEAVEAALMGEDYSDGALYFMARKYADSDNVEWFDKKLEPVLVHGGHEFYK